MILQATIDTGTSISLTVVIALGSAVIGSVGAYVKLKSTIDVLKAEVQDIKDSKKELASALHRRIDETKNQMTMLQKEVTIGHSKLEASMSNMKLEIIEKFQDIVRDLTKDRK